MGSRMKEDQHRVTALLKDTVTLLCKNGLTYKKNMKIQGLLGITLDDDEVFIVHLNESMANLDAVPDESNNQTNSDASDGRTPSKRRRRRRSSASSDNTFTTPSKRRNTNERRSNVQVKTEPETITLDEIKIHDSDSDEGGGALDDGLNFAINSISSLNDSGSSTLPQQTNKNMTSSFASPSSEQPFITGFVTNQANIPEPSQSSSNSSFAWDSSAAQGHPNMASWAGQITQQTMSQTPQSIVHSGMSQVQPDMSQAGTSQAGTSMDSSSASRHGTTSLFGMETYENADCQTCRQYARRNRINLQRKRLKRLKAPEEQWPRFEEPILSTNKVCALCVQRYQYYRHKSLARKSMVAKGLAANKTGFG